MRKLMILMAAIAALGVMAVSASAASANVTLKRGTTPLVPGETLEGTSHNLTTTTNGGVLACETVEIGGTVTANGGSTAEVEEGGGSATNCAAGAAPVVITNIEIPFIIFNEDHSDEAFMRFEYLIITGPESHLTCSLEGPVFTHWTPGSSIDEVTGAELVGEGAGCPTEGTMEGEIALHQGAAEVTVN